MFQSFLDCIDMREMVIRLCWMNRQPLLKPWRVMNKLDELHRFSVLTQLGPRGFVTTKAEAFRA
jgi:hypothetical protein